MKRPLKVIFLDFTGTIDVSDYKGSWCNDNKPATKAEKKAAKKAAKDDPHPRRTALVEKYATKDVAASGGGMLTGGITYLWDITAQANVPKRWHTGQVRYVRVNEDGTEFTKKSTQEDTIWSWSDEVQDYVQKRWDVGLQKYVPVDEAPAKKKSSVSPDPPYEYDNIRGVWVPKKKGAVQTSFYDNVDDGCGSFDSYRGKQSSYYGGKGRTSGSGAYNYFGGLYGRAASFIGDTFKSSYTYGPNKECVRLLKKLLDKTGAKIVYSSTRRYDGWKKCAEFVGLPLRYSLGLKKFGVTPGTPYDYSPRGGAKTFKQEDEYFDPLHEDEPLSQSEAAGHQVTEYGVGGYVYSGWKQREKEIKMWLDSWKKPLANYVILDDDPIKSPDMAPHWIPSIAQNGFKQDEYKKALRILSK